MNWGAINKSLFPLVQKQTSLRVAYNVLERTPLRGCAPRLRESCEALSPVVGVPFNSRAMDCCVNYLDDYRLFSFTEVK